MAETTWDNEIYPGVPETYNEELLTYNHTASFQGAGQPRYNTIGLTTSWTNENK